MTKTHSTRVSAPDITQPEVNDASSENFESNDAARVNPSGPRAVDRRSNKSGNNLLNCKNETHVATINVRTLRHQGKTDELAYAFNKANLDILGVVDHKLVHDEVTQTKNLEKCTLITSSAWRNSNGASSGGVGLLVSKTTESALAGIIPFNERIIIAHFNGNPMTTVIVHYSPTEGAPSLTKWPIPSECPSSCWATA
ncbi:MAG: hypothetical protein AAF512_17545 [Pseudomonadota bacterium]